MELESAPGWIKPRWKSIQLVPGKFGKWCFCTESKPRQATKSHCWCDDRSFPINHGDPRRGPSPNPNQSPTDVVGLWPIDHRAWFPEEVPIVQLIPIREADDGSSFAPHEDPWAGCFVRFRPYRMQKSIMTKFLMTETNPGFPQEEDAPDFPKRSCIKI